MYTKIFFCFVTSVSDKPGDLRSAELDADQYQYHAGKIIPFPRRIVLGRRRECISETVGYYFSLFLSG